MFSLAKTQSELTLEGKIRGLITEITASLHRSEMLIFTFYLETILHTEAGRRGCFSSRDTVSGIKTTSA